jgi:DNA-binding transcriptional regulator YiaG
MKKKRIKLKTFEHESLLGVKVFKNVAAWIYENVDLSNFNPEKDEYFIDDKETMRLEREVAQSFVSRKLQEKTLELTAEEVSGIRMVLGLNATEFAKIIGITKGTMSKILRGTIKMKRPECILALMWLIKELDSDTGFIKPQEKVKASNRKEDKDLAQLLEVLGAA